MPPPSRVAILFASFATVATAHAQQAWTFDLTKTVVHEAWIGEDTVYLRAPYAYRKEDDDIPVTPGLPLLTYKNDKGYPEDAALAAIDLKTGTRRWTRGYSGDYRFILDPLGKDLWAMSATFDRLDSVTGKTSETVPFTPTNAEYKKSKDTYRTIHGIRINGEVSWGGSRFGRSVNESLPIYDFDTKEVLQFLVNAKTPNKLRQADLAIDRSPKLQQTHVQLRPIGGGNAVWRFSAGGYSTNPPVMLGSDVLAMTGMPGTVGLVVRLDGATGAPRWVTRLPRGAYSISQAQLKDGWYGEELWSAVGKLDETHLFAVGGDGTINVLAADNGEILARFKTDNVLLAPPRLLNNAIVVVGENHIVSVPNDVAYGKVPHPALTQKLNAANSLLAEQRFVDACKTADEATDIWPVSAEAWRVLTDACIGANHTNGVVRAACRFLELSDTVTTPYLQQQYGLLARIDTGALRVSVVDLGLFVYAPSTDGILYVIDPVSLQVVEKTTMQGDASIIRLRGNQLLRAGDDRRVETLLTVANAPLTSTRDDPLFGSRDEHTFYPVERNATETPREWTTVGGPYGPQLELNGRLIRTLTGGGIRELVKGEVVDRPAVLDGVDRWHIVRTATGPLGCGMGGMFKLDADYRPDEFLVDLRDDGSNSGMPAVLTADTDGETLAFVRNDPRKFPRILKLSLRSADGKCDIRSEAILPPGPFDDLELEGARLFKLGEGYFYAGGELVWIPTDPAKPVWRFRANDDPDRDRPNVRNEPIDRSFGIPRIRDGKLFVGCRYGGVYVFDVNAIVGRRK
jgi:outer membrane protein assembly factor BamB